MNMMLRIQTEARNRGYELHELTSAQYDSIAKSIRTVPELMRDGTSRYLSEIKKECGRVVSLPIMQAREAKCQTDECGMFSVLADGEPACNGCNCSGKYLRTKWALPGSVCPHDPPLWREENADPT